MRRELLLATAILSLSACDGSSVPTPVPTPSPSPTPTPAAVKVSVQIQPAEVASLSLADLDIDPGAAITAVTPGTLTAIKAADVKIVDGELRVLAPGDLGSDASFVVALLEAGGRKIEVTVTMVSTLATAVSVPAEATDGTPAAPPLSITGLGPANTLPDGSLQFKVAGAPALDPVISRAFISDSAGVTHPLGPRWSFDPATNSFTLAASDVAALRAAVASGPMTLTISLLSEDASFAHSYEVTLLKGGNKLDGKLVDDAGAAVTSLAGRSVGVVGTTTGFRRTTSIGADGSFTADGLPPDTYRIELLDLDNPGFTGSVIGIFAESNTVSVDLVYFSTSASASASSSAKSGSSAKAQRAVAGRASGFGAILSPRNQPAAPFAALSNCASTTPEETSYSVSAAAQNDTVSCNFDHVVPDGTQAVEVKVTVSTAEFPTYTQSRSKYNDRWSFSFSGAPGLPPAESRAVNDSHFTSGSFTRTRCVDVSKLTVGKTLTIRGSLKSTNVGDGALTTTVAATFRNGCSGLTVTSAKLGTTNKQGFTVVAGAGAPDVSPYVSIPQSAAFTNFGIPFDIAYSPKEATLTKVELGVVQNGNVVRWSDNLLGGATGNTPGKLRFADLIVPVLPFTRQTRRLSFTLRLTGTLNGETVTSPEGEQNVSINGATAFTPLFLAGEESALSARRYGNRDAEGDSWATQAMIGWLGSNSYRFDDISGLHAARASGKCNGGTQVGSTLGHCGHSNGQQVDLRYYSPEGTFTDPIGDTSGPTLLALIQTARGQGPGGAATKRLINWIAYNRAMLDDEGGKATTLKIWISPQQWFLRALIHGQYDDGTPILFATPEGNIPVAKWTPPTKLGWTGGHETHWHLSTSNP